MTVDKVWFDLFWSDLTVDAQTKILQIAEQAGFSVQQEIMDDAKELESFLIDEDGIS